MSSAGAAAARRDMAGQSRDERLGLTDCCSPLRFISAMSRSSHNCGCAARLHMFQSSTKCTHPKDTNEIHLHRGEANLFREYTYANVDLRLGNVVHIPATL